MRLKVELWDTFGEERFRSLTGNYYSGSAAILVCYSLVDRKSVSSASQYIIDAVEQSGRSSMFCSCPSVFLVGNKADLRQATTDDETNNNNEEEDDLVKRLQTEFSEVHAGGRGLIVACRGLF